MSLRLPEEKAAELAAVARAIASRRADKDFQKRLKRRLDEDREVLERLAK